MLPSIQLERVTALRQVTATEMAERAAGLFLLLLTSPLLISSALVVSALARRSPLVAHLRIGRPNRPFWMLKLRSMWGPGTSSRGWTKDVIAEPPEDGKQPGDPRVTSRFAAFCRRHSIDEIPQFWH